jgi:hypothetical protein
MRKILTFLKIFCEKYKHFRRHFEFSELATIFFQKKDVKSVTFPKVTTFHSAVLLSIFLAIRRSES